MSRTVLFNLFSDNIKKKKNFRSRYKPNKEIIFLLSIPHIGEKSFATGKLFLLTFHS